ncbi:MULTISPECIES: PTS sugar transporter subunit IIA [Aerococcus]|uniref:PTS sugar transporter subunit IIA n=1 Tax=Aerococcus loyolae TaxID=2976809 RepID=A0ABT4C0G6_9LACT|nr:MULTISPECIES: PTS sugar transporter subunit IIA [Aerococcus]KAA9220714.1 PTS sugar transporter subunit IIA [Aerococcus loyolae]KAA9265435.1 PTS sugar transporter subunit IIA [Aerococcus loyolae]MCY3025026.1 PTS sugar transporter subunit IIA [Aerococcus loyolae]MCY3026917.1 PTS sugar transporter subunit IIA [Aerococcus loyolae]MCY3028502.1 PTS sugar transporter subunit IIA [Aerococcus loyolae]
MSNSIGLLLISHGDLAHAAIKSAELIVGSQENYETVGVDVIDDVQEIKHEIIDKVKQLDISKGLIILTDIIGGTPINLASQLLDREDTVVVSGLNLPMLLDILIRRESNLESIILDLPEVYQKGFSLRTHADMEKEGEENEYSL